MGAWGEYPLENDTGLDRRSSIFEKFGIDFCEYETDNCAILTNNDRKNTFKSMLPDLFKYARHEVDTYKTTHEAHCVAQFVIQNNVSLSKQEKQTLIDILNGEDYDCWVEPNIRKVVVKQVIRDLNRI